MEQKDTHISEKVRELLVKALDEKYEEEFPSPDWKQKLKIDENKERFMNHRYYTYGVDLKTEYISTLGLDKYKEIENYTLSELSKEYCCAKCGKEPQKVLVANFGSYDDYFFNFAWDSPGDTFQCGDCKKWFCEDHILFYSRTSSYYPPFCEDCMGGFKSYDEKSQSMSKRKKFIESKHDNGRRLFNFSIILILISIITFFFKWKYFFVVLSISIVLLIWGLINKNYQYKNKFKIP